MEDRIKLPFTFDVPRLQEDLKRLAGVHWIDHFVTQNYLGDWQVVPLRGAAGATHPVMMIYSDPACRDFVDTPFLQASEYLPEVLASLRCPLLAARLMKLTPGSRIKEHSDLDLDMSCGVVRLHVPICTNSQVEFRLNNTLVSLREGECWYLRLSDPHSVINGGTTDRVHLVVDALVNDWLATQLERAVAGTEASEGCE